jgi:hypothetical protein
MFAAQSHDLFLKGCFRPGRTFVWAARAIHQAFWPLTFKALQPLVTNRGADAKTPTQLPDIGITLKG